MKLVICICTYNRNHSLLRCLKAIDNLHEVFNIKIEVIVVDNSIKYNSLKAVKKIKKSFPMNPSRQLIIGKSPKSMFLQKKR